MNFRGLIKDKLEAMVPSSWHSVRISEITYGKYLAHRAARYKGWFNLSFGEEGA